MSEPIPPETRGRGDRFIPPNGEEKTMGHSRYIYYNGNQYLTYFNLLTGKWRVLIAQGIKGTPPGVKVLSR